MRVRVDIEFKKTDGPDVEIGEASESLTDEIMSLTFEYDESVFEVTGTQIVDYP